MTLTSATLLFIGQGNSALFTAFISLAMGIGSSMFLPAIQAEIEDICRKDPEHENQVVGDTSAIWNVGFILGAILLGWLSELTHSYAISFGATGIIILVSLFYYLLTKSHVKAK